jgi:hypothetical protein
MVLASINSNAREISIEELDERIRLSANYLKMSILDSGVFDYRVNMNPSVSVKRKYNILRHAGAIYSMNMYHDLTSDTEIKIQIIKAGNYLKNYSIFTVEQEKALAIWSVPEVNNYGAPLQAKLGGTGLGLVALMGIESISPGFMTKNDYSRLGEFIRYMQKEDGSFYSKYIPEYGGRYDKWNSLYYPGEAALGIFMLYERHPSLEWLESGYQALEYLSLSRQNESIVPADHWALLATARFFEIDDRKLIEASDELLIEHALQITNQILKEQVLNPTSNNMLYGGFAFDGRTTPTATRLEGLLAVLTFLPESHPLREKIISSVEKGIVFLANAQIKEGAFAGAIPRSIMRMNSNTDKAISFNSRVTEVRIDYVQHALSAFIQYKQFLLSEGKVN